MRLVYGSILLMALVGCGGSSRPSEPSGNNKVFDEKPTSKYSSDFTTDKLNSYFGFDRATGTNEVLCSLSLTYAYRSEGGVTWQGMRATHGDYAVCSEGTKEVRSDDNGFFTDVQGLALTLPYREGATYSLKFVRASGETYTATVVFPPSTPITFPTAGAKLPKGKSFTATWNGSEKMAIRLYPHSSSAKVASDVASNGQYTFQATDLQMSEPGDIDADLSLEKSVPGNQPDGIDGHTEATQSSVVNFSFVD